MSKPVVVPIRPVEQSTQIVRLGTAETPPLILPGEYELTYQWHQVRRLHARALKLEVTFHVVTPGQAFEASVSRFYNLSKGDPRTGKFTVGFYSDAYREFCLLFGTPPRLDRIPMSRFKNRVLLGRVETVTRDRRQKTLPIGAQYSVVRELMRVMA